MRTILTARRSRLQSIVRLCLLCVIATCGASAAAQERFSLFVPTEPEDVPRMLKLVNLRDGDVVFDLGSGDGRIPIEAAKLNANVRGRGIEIDAKLVAESTLNARAAGVDGRVQFLHQNAFDADLKEATVIAMWLWPELMRMLRPKILMEARPGTRIVTRIWDLGTWKPDTVDKNGAELYMWVVPAQVEGYWDWTLEFAGAKRNYAAVLEQHFQEIEGVVRVGDRRNVFDSMKLKGDEITFTLSMTFPGVKLTRHEFSGRVKGDTIEGVVRIQHEPFEEAFVLPWRARRATSSHYFASTGIKAQ